MRTILSILFLSIFALSGYGQSQLSLDEAISIALQRNTMLRKASNQIDAYESNVKAAYGNFLPSLSANGNWILVPHRRSRRSN